MAVLSDAALWKLSQDTFGPQLAPTMFAIAKAESGGKTDAKNLTGLDRSYGLWQINVHPKANPQMAQKYDLTDPAQNAQAAKEILQQQGPKAWTTYSGGAYQKYMPAGSSDMTMDFSDEELMALLGEGGSPFQGGSLPLGYVFDPNTGSYARALPDGSLVPVGMEEIQAAAIAQARANKSVEGRSQQGFNSLINERTGEAMVFDPNTGRFGGTGQQVGFAGVDPREKFRVEADAKAREQAIDMLKQSQDALIEMARDADTAKRGRAQLRSDERQGNANRRESARQADLRAAVDQWQTAMNLIPQMGQLSLQESERVQSILSDGGDYLARAFESQGGQSPLGRVTQADQINAIRGSLDQLRGMVAANAARGPATGGGYQDAELTDVGAYEAPDFSGLPAVPNAPSYSFGPVEVGPATFNPGSFGGFTPQDEQGYVLPSAPAATPEPSVIGSGGFNGVMGVQGELEPYEEIVTQPAAPHAANTWAIPNAEGGFGGQGVPSSSGVQPGEPNYFGPSENPTWGAPIPGSARSGGGSWGDLPWTVQRFAPTFADGSEGMVRDPAMIVGDSLDSRPNPEMIVNPTRAPLAVVSPRFGPVDLPQYGLGSWLKKQGKRLLRLDEAERASPNNAFGRPQPKSNVPIRRYATGTMDVTNTGPQGYVDTPGMRFGTVAGAEGTGSYYVNPNGSQGYSGPTSGETYNAYLTGVLGYKNEDAMKVSGFRPQNYGPGGDTEPMGFGSVARAPITQADLVRMAKSNAPPSVRNVMAGKLPGPRNALSATDGSGEKMRQLTARQLSALNAEDLKALGTYTNTVFNAPLSYVTENAMRQYGPSSQRRGGFLGAAGI